MTGRIIILGGSSFVGRSLQAAFGAGRALATFNSKPFEGGRHFDSTAMRVTDLVGAGHDFSHAVVLLGDTQPDSCIADPARSERLNVESIVRVFDDLAGLGIKPVFTSSEFVFDGVKGDYVETDAAEPILLYGRQKLAAERYLQSLGIPSAILRLAKVYGDRPGDGSLFTGWLASLRHGGKTRCAADQAFSPVYVGDVVLAIEAAVERDIDGLYHVSGNRRFTRLELLEMFIDVMRERHGRFDVAIEPCSIHDFDLPERRPVDVSMRSDKLVRDTGIELTDARAVCERIALAAAA
jgi:dTDP-4-dehydrorhamnose reductase